MPYLEVIRQIVVLSTRLRLRCSLVRRRGLGKWLLKGVPLGSGLVACVRSHVFAMKFFLSVAFVGLESNGKCKCDKEMMRHG